MKIARVTTTGVRGLPDQTFDLTDSASGQPLDMVIVTGPPSCGKTSFLDAIAAAKEDVSPYGARRSPLPYVRRGALAAKIKIDWWFGEAERQRLGLDKPELSSESILAAHIPPSNSHDARLVAILGAYDHSSGTPKMEYFHEHRTLARGSTGSSALQPADQRGLRLGKELFKYAVLPRWLVELCLDGGGGPEEFGKRFSALCKTKRFGGIRKTYNAREPYFVAADGAELEIGDLSASEQQAVLFVGASMFLGLAGSVLLVDGPEKHIESANVVPFAFALQGLGPDNQLIVATGSKELVAAAAAKSVIRLGAPGGST